VAWDTTGSPLKAQGDIKLMLKIVLSTDCALSELVEIRREDVYLDEDKIWVRKGYGNRQRFIPILDSYKAEMITYLDNTNTKYLFEPKSHGRYSEAGLRRLIGRVCGGTGDAKGARPDVLRKKIAAWFRRRSRPVPRRASPSL
jgi:integrase